MQKVAKTANEVTLWQFKMVINNDDVRYLLILDSYNELPDVDVAELELAWYNIYREYSEIVGGNRADLWLLKQKQFISMKLEYEIGACLLRVIKEIPHPELLEMAEKFGFFIKIDDLEKTFIKARAKLVRLKNKIVTTEKEMSKTEDEKANLDPLIVMLEKHQGYQFNEHEMTVNKFANIYRSFKIKGNG